MMTAEWLAERARMDACFLCLDLIENNTVMVGRKTFAGLAQLERIARYLAEVD